MAWARKLIERAVRDEEAGLGEALGMLYRGFTERAQQLERHAGAAPTAQAESALRGLAAEDESMASRLRGAIQTAGFPVPVALPPPSTPEGPSHWARLTNDLELHRQAFRRLREAAIEAAADRPQLQALLEALGYEEQRHAERLRGLIARADPQALN
jgi:hypothetical protein